MDKLINKIRDEVKILAAQVRGEIRYFGGNVKTITTAKLEQAIKKHQSLSEIRALKQLGHRELPDW